VSYITVLSVLVARRFGFPFTSVTVLDASDATIVPFPVAVTGTVHVILSDVVGVPTVPAPVPDNTTSPAVNVTGSIASEKTTVKLIALLLVGSTCPTG
jgi:hypothetical protein